MELTHEFLFERIKDNPIEHLGGYSPKLLSAYFMGYEDARRFHGHSSIAGRLGLGQLYDWFRLNAYAGREGPAAFCQLLTDTEEKALDLFYAFRRLALETPEIKSVGDTSDASNQDNYAGQDRLSLTSLTLHQTMRTKTAMYFGNEMWLRGMWAMWSGYIWAEEDIGIVDSKDAQNFREFQAWLDERYPFAKAPNWGKMMEFLGMGVNANALEQFYDHFELFLEGSPPEGQTKRMKEWIAACLADVEERQAKGEL